MIKKFRKLPVVIEAAQWDGSNAEEIIDWVGLSGGGRRIFQVDTFLRIKTLEGDMNANLNDWVIKGIKGEFYPCKPDIFDRTCEEV